MSLNVAKEQSSLLLLILADMRGHLLIIMLGVALVLSAFFNIYMTHQTRALITQKDQLSQKKDNLQIEWRNLLIEEHTLDEHSRIRRIAMKKLSMTQVSINQSVLVEL
ncbi:cell division protein FtsL [Psychromonas sp. PRT-SC03]|nr:cell division protein FtsL [Psychromonas sp. PRT-SC03]